MPIDNTPDFNRKNKVTKKQPHKRNRGVRLSAQGVRRLQHAIAQAEIQENEGKRFSVEKIGLRSGVSTATMSRVWSAKTGVDQRTLQLIFSAFNLDLTDSDLLSLGGDPASKATGLKADETSRSESAEMSYPSGPIPLGSALYVARPPLEERAMHEVTQPGCVIRIKAPSGFGKSSLLLRVVAKAEELGYAIASIDLYQADPTTLADPGAFLRWFCNAVALKLGTAPNLERSWSDILGHSLSTTLFIQEQILATSSSPIVLNIQEFNCLFAFPQTSQAFLPLLRSWYEEARHDPDWQRLRQIVTYSTDSYLPLDINQSPFNVGLPIVLPEFTAAQIRTLARLHHLALDDEMWRRLMALVGGHPTLIRIALYHLGQGDVSLDDLIAMATTPDSIFHPYLHQMLVRVQDGPKQMEGLKAIVMADGPIALDPIMAYQLEATGLIDPTPDGWVMRLHLYRDYFRQRLFEVDE